MEKGSGTILAADWAREGTHLFMRVAQVSCTRHPGMACSRNLTQIVQSTGGNVPLPISPPVQKARDSVKFLQRWLKNNPNARPGDIAAAENVLKDLLDALSTTPVKF